MRRWLDRAGRHTLLFWRYADRYLVSVEGDFDFAAWAEDFRWERDPVHGLVDFVSHPADTVASGRGDCEDLALVALSWLDSQDSPAYLGLAYRPHAAWGPLRGVRLPRHVVASDGRRVFEARGDGARTWGSVEEYLNHARYDDLRLRRVNG